MTGHLVNHMKINTEECNLCSGEGCGPGRMTVLGWDSRKKEKEKKEYYYLLCPKCKGTGKIDWVSRITGSRPAGCDLPFLGQLTELVRKLITEGNIFGTDGIVMEQKRRKLLRRIEDKKNESNV